MIDGDTIAVVSHDDDGAVPGTSCASGAVWVFRRADEGDGVVWRQEAKLRPDEPDEQEELEDEFSPKDPVCWQNFGYLGLALAGDRLLVGAAGYDGTLQPTTGSRAYVFRRDRQGTETSLDDEWEFEDRLRPASQPPVSDRFGFGVATAGDSAVVGASKEADGRGSVYVFARQPDGSWTQTQKIESGPGIGAGDELGATVAMDGDWLAVGAGRDDAAGSVLLFRRNGATWDFHAKLTPSMPSLFGYHALGMDAGRLVVSAAFHTAAGGSGAGVAYVYRRDDPGTPGDPSDDV